MPVKMKPDNQLTSLEGAPKWVTGGFNCNNNHLPKEINA